MDKQQRQEKVAELRRSGLTLKSIARVLGVSSTTVHSDITQLTRLGRLVQPAQIVYSDGRRGPAHWRPRGRIALPGRCPDCGEGRADGRIRHLLGCSRAWL